mmetsp:Transcript_50288/g.130899  ORF Transcript_50288/g.130899 Transcript_50288/m.130899 type:complete len:215 (-) Transcript_50288:100-744(-)
MSGYCLRRCSSTRAWLLPIPILPCCGRCPICSTSPTARASTSLSDRSCCRCRRCSRSTRWPSARPQPKWRRPWVLHPVTRCISELCSRDALTTCLQCAQSGGCPSKQARRRTACCCDLAVRAPPLSAVWRWGCAGVRGQRQRMPPCDIASASSNQECDELNRARHGYGRCAPLARLARLARLACWRKWLWTCECLSMCSRRAPVCSRWRQVSIV